MSTDKFESLQSLIQGQGASWLSNFDDRPSRLFDGLEHIQLTIILVAKDRGQPLLPFTTRCRKWSAIERSILFSTLCYSQLHQAYLPGSVEKAGSDLEVSILDKIWLKPEAIRDAVRDSGVAKIFYTRKVHAFLNVLDFVPEIYDGRGKLREPSEQKVLAFESELLANAALCALNSTLFRWFLSTYSDCRNLNRREVLAFPLDLGRFADSEAPAITELAGALSESLQRTSEIREMRFGGDVLRVQCIIPRFSKPILDEIERALARHYRLTDEELDFIINYDIKYRMGPDAEDDGG